MRLKFFQGDDVFDGMFTYLYKHYQPNPFSPFLYVNVSGSYENRADPLYVFVPNVYKDTTSEIWLSSNLPNSSYTITFKNHRFQMDSYSVRSRGDQDFNIPLEWVLEASNDLVNWVEIHHKHRNRELVGKLIEKNYICPNQRFFTSYKFTQIGENAHNYDYEKYLFSIATLEFFGTFVDTYNTDYELNFILLNKLVFLFVSVMAPTQ